MNKVLDFMIPRSLYYLCGICSVLACYATTDDLGRTFLVAAFATGILAIGEDINKWHHEGLE